MKAWLLSLHKAFIFAPNLYKNRAKMGEITL